MEMMVTDHMERNVVYQKQIHRGFDLGLSATVLSLLPFGLAGDRRNNATHVYQIERVEEKMFHPASEYVQKSVLQPDVLGYLARHWYRKSLYMVVGVRIGVNAEVTHSSTCERAGKMNVSVSGALTGIPLDVGGTSRCSASDKYYQRKSIPSSFVFAYRLREIRYSKRYNVTRNTEFTKGAELHNLYGRVRARNQLYEAVEYKGTEDEIKVSGLLEEDIDEDEPDTRSIGNCIMIGSAI
jgi:hypothetical protein